MILLCVVTLQPMKVPVRAVWKSIAEEFIVL